MKLVAFAGRKNSGKNTCCNIIKTFTPNVKEFSFAEPLKRMCVDILGMEERQAFGSEDDKNTIVPHLLWENFPVPAWEYADGSITTTRPNFAELVSDSGAAYEDSDWYPPRLPRLKTGPMTARQVMQFWGSDIFRKAYAQVWVEATMRNINKSSCELAVITDCRFPNEFEAVQEAGGKVIKLTRNVFPNDNHPSETALEYPNFDQGRFDGIIENHRIQLNLLSDILYIKLLRFGCINTQRTFTIY